MNIDFRLYQKAWPSFALFFLILGFKIFAWSATVLYNDSPIECDKQIKWNGKPGGCRLCIGKSGDKRSYVCSTPFSPREQNRLQQVLRLARSYNTAYPPPREGGFDAFRYVENFQPILCADSYVELEQLRYRMELIKANQGDLSCKRPSRGPASLRLPHYKQ